MSQITQMRNAHALGLNDAAQVISAQSALPAVVICRYLRERKLRRAAAQLNAGGVVVVGMTVAANYAVCVQRLELQTAHAAGGIGVEHHAAVGAYKLKAGVAMPNKLHFISPQSRTGTPA